MNRKTLLVIIAATSCLVALLMTVPAFSGEHPWDSDRTDGGKGSNNTFVTDTTHVLIDTVAIVTTSKPAMAPSDLHRNRLIRTIWSAWMAM